MVQNIHTHTHTHREREREREKRSGLRILSCVYHKTDASSHETSTTRIAPCEEPRVHDESESNICRPEEEGHE